MVKVQVHSAQSLSVCAFRPVFSPEAQMFQSESGQIMISLELILYMQISLFHCGFMLWIL